MSYISIDDYATKRDRTKFRKEYKDFNNSLTLECIKKQKIAESKDAKLLEISYVKDKYSLYPRQDESLIKFYIPSYTIPSGSIIKITSLLDKTLKYIFRFTEEDICDFYRKDLMILKSSYVSFKNRLFVFNHFGLLEDALFNGKYYLSIYSRFDVFDIYAMLNTYNISSIKELTEKLDIISENSMKKLKRKNTLTKEIINEFEIEFLKKLKRETFMYEYEQRRLVKQKNGN